MTTDADREAIDATLTEFDAAAASAPGEKEEDQRHEADRECVISETSGRLDLADARAILAADREERAHTANCHLPVDKCATCMDLELRDCSEIEAHNIELAAARRVIGSAAAPAARAIAHPPNHNEPLAPGRGAAAWGEAVDAVNTAFDNLDRVERSLIEDPANDTEQLHELRGALMAGIGLLRSLADRIAAQVNCAPSSSSGDPNGSTGKPGPKSL